MNTLDRYILKSLIINFIIALFSMISLYCVLDLFINIDEFTENDYPTLVVAKNIWYYYSSQVFLYYDQIAGVITIFACLSTISKMRSENELTAILASGVSLFRVAAPVICFAVFTASLMVINAEFIIPGIAHNLSRNHDNIQGDKTFDVYFIEDDDNQIMFAKNFNIKENSIKNLLVIKRDAKGEIDQTIQAEKAEWVSDEVDFPDGVWKLTRSEKTRRVFDVTNELAPVESRVIEYPRFYKSKLSPKDIITRQSKNWIKFLSWKQLAKMQKKDDSDSISIWRTKQTRITKPMINLVMLLLGLPFFLDRSPLNVLSSAGKCMLTTGLCYITTFVSQSVQPDSTSAIPFWIPIFTFGIVAAVLIDRMKT